MRLKNTGFGYCPITFVYGFRGFQGLGWSECRIRCQLQGGAGKEKATGSETDGFAVCGFMSRLFCGFCFVIPGLGFSGFLRFLPSVFCFGQQGGELCFFLRCQGTEEVFFRHVGFLCVMEPVSVGVHQAHERIRRELIEAAFAVARFVAVMAMGTAVSHVMRMAVVTVMYMFFHGGFRCFGSFRGFSVSSI